MVCNTPRGNNTLVRDSKSNREFVLTNLALLPFIVSVAVFWNLTGPAPSSLRLGADVVEANDQVFSYDGYAVVLETYVDDEGMVNYAELKAESERLRTFVEALGRLDSKAYDGWSEKEKIAFWINVYNALTLHVIIKHYPIKPSFIGSLRYPKNSIRQISGVWDKIEFPVMGRKMTLEFVEHGILRKVFNEPRIHMALVCAAMGCPPLRNEPFTGTELDEQLDDQARRLLGDPQKFRIDRESRGVHLSPIFEWFGKDFVKTHGTDEMFAGHDHAEWAVLNFISKYLDDGEAEYLTTAGYAVKYMDYDWSLNEKE